MSKQEGSAVYNIVAFIFADPNRAKEVSKELKHEAKGAGYKIIANAVVDFVYILLDPRVRTS